MSKQKSPLGRNGEVYQDVLTDLRKIVNGIFAFSLRTNAGLIHEYTLTRLGRFNPSKNKVIYDDGDRVQLLNLKPMETATFLAVINQAISQTPFGTISFNLMVQGGTPRLGTISFNSNVRKKYKL